MVWFWPASASAQGETRELIPAVTREASLPTLAIKADFHLGKTWHETLQPFPALEKRLLVVNLTITNTSDRPQKPLSRRVWLYLHGEDQRISRVRGRTGPQVHLPSTNLLDPDAAATRSSNGRSRPGVPRRPGAGQPDNNSGVMVDLGRTKDQTSAISCRNSFWLCSKKNSAPPI